MCGSTAWCPWNHLSVFHLYAGALGPAHADLLTSIVDRHEWACFPAGAGSRPYGRADSDGGGVTIDGPTTFGSGCRYGEWTGLVFALVEPETGKPATPPDLRFTIVRLDEPTVRIERTWDGMALRASATDTVHHDGTRGADGADAPRRGLVDARRGGGRRHRRLRPLLASRTKCVLPPRPCLMTNFPARAIATSVLDGRRTGDDRPRRGWVNRQ